MKECSSAGPIAATTFEHAVDFVSSTPTSEYLSSGSDASTSPLEECATIDRASLTSPATFSAEETLDARWTGLTFSI